MAQITVNDLKPRDVISFEVYPLAILGNNFKNVTVDAVLSANTVSILGFDFAATHAMVYPSLPPGTPDDGTQYDYLRIIFESGEPTYIGIPWIRPDTLTKVAGTTLTLIFNNIDNTRKDRIIAAVRSINEPPDSVIFN